jgi:hypothetical protein
MKEACTLRAGHRTRRQKRRKERRFHARKEGKKRRELTGSKGVNPFPFSSSMAFIGVLLPFLISLFSMCVLSLDLLSGS